VVSLLFFLVVLLLLRFPLRRGWVGRHRWCFSLWAPTPAAVSGRRPAPLCGPRREDPGEPVPQGLQHRGLLPRPHTVLRSPPPCMTICRQYIRPGQAG
jgi:hypothetical protein